MFSTKINCHFCSTCSSTSLFSFRGGKEKKNKKQITWVRMNRNRRRKKKVRKQRLVTPPLSSFRFPLSTFHYFFCFSFFQTSSWCCYLISLHKIFVGNSVFVTKKWIKKWKCGLHSRYKAKDRSIWCTRRTIQLVQDGR